MSKKRNNQARFVKFFLVVLAMFIALIISTKYTQKETKTDNTPKLEHNQTK